jgi:hypothetical protein
MTSFRRKQTTPKSKRKNKREFSEFESRVERLERKQKLIKYKYKDAEEV